MYSRYESLACSVCRYYFCSRLRLANPPAGTSLSCHVNPQRHMAKGYNSSDAQPTVRQMFDRCSRSFKCGVGRLFSVRQTSFFYVFFLTNNRKTAGTKYLSLTIYEMLRTWLLYEVTRSRVNECLPREGGRCKYKPSKRESGISHESVQSDRRETTTAELVLRIFGSCQAGHRTIHTYVAAGKRMYSLVSNLTEQHVMNLKAKTEALP